MLRKEWTDAPGEAMPPLRLVSLAMAREGKLALTLAGPDRWHENQGYVFMPAEIPGATLEGPDLDGALAALALRRFGRHARIQSSRYVYGPSAAHAIDRLPMAPGERPVPLLRLERGTPLDEMPAEGMPGLRRVEVRCYLARLEGEGALAPAPEVAGVLWVAPGALRSVMRGMPLAEVLTLRGVEWRPGSRLALPEDAFVYVPAEYGERHLVRIAAKYGPSALFQDSPRDERERDDGGA